MKKLFKKIFTWFGWLADRHDNLFSALLLVCLLLPLPAWVAHFPFDSPINIIGSIVGIISSLVLVTGVVCLFVLADKENNYRLLVAEAKDILKKYSDKYEFKTLPDIISQTMKTTETGKLCYWLLTWGALEWKIIFLELREEVFSGNIPEFYVKWENIGARKRKQKEKTKEEVTEKWKHAFDDHLLPDVGKHKAAMRDIEKELGLIPKTAIPKTA